MLRITLALVSAGLLAGLWSCVKKADAQPAATPSARGIAVVELFTSAGCSSCPPADAVLSRIVRDARQNNRDVFPLAFHVDYWNRLGWADRFSSADYSARQQAYGSALNLSQIYTPQMIVNGSVEFVGSDSARARAEIDAALAAPAPLSLRLVVNQKDRALDVKYRLDPLPRGSAIHFAIVERGLSSDVKAGENQGQLLQHDNVVRAFKSLDLVAPQGDVALTVPDAVAMKNASVIAFVQELSSMRITGGAQADLADR